MRYWETTLLIWYCFFTLSQLQKQQKCGIEAHELSCSDKFIFEISSSSWLSAIVCVCYTRNCCWHTYCAQCTRLHPFVFVCLWFSAATSADASIVIVIVAAVDIVIVSFLFPYDSNMNSAKLKFSYVIRSFNVCNYISHIQKDKVHSMLVIFHLSITPFTA